MKKRIVLVTGATGGLGPAVVRAFEESGAEVIAVSRSTGSYQADLTDPQQATSLVHSLMAEYGRIDVAVHVMGGYAGGSGVQDTDDETWNRMMAVNLNSAFYVFRALLPYMIESRRGRLIAVGSRAGVQPAANACAYTVSKAGLHALVQTIAAEVKDLGITANAVLPSTIDTAANRTWGSAEQAAQWVKPESIAQVILWLASETAADVNGALIPVYGRA